MIESAMGEPTIDGSAFLSDGEWTGLFRAVFRWVFVAWAVGSLAVLAATVAMSDDVARAAVVIMVASGLISAVSTLVALMPGKAPLLGKALMPGKDLLPGKFGSLRRVMQAGLAGHFFANQIASMILRLIGTVALFLTCRYHMTAAVEMIAAMTLGWYLFLTTIETTVLALRLPKALALSAAGAVEAATLTART